MTTTKLHGSSTAETGKNTRRAPNTKLLAAIGVAGLGGAYVAGLLTNPASTDKGGGTVFEKCTDYVETMTLSDGAGFQLGVGDLSTTGLRGTEDVLKFEMVDGSLSVTDPGGDAEEYTGTQDQRIVAAGSDMSFKENGATVTVALDQNRGVTITKTC